MMSLMVPVSIYTVHLSLYSVVYDLYLLTVNCVSHMPAIAAVLATYQTVTHNIQ